MTRQTKINTLLTQYNLSTEKELQEFLKKKYYSEVPAITDEEYDELFGDKDYVGYIPEQNGPWQVLDHRIAMGSLSKLKTWQQAEDWLKDKGDVVWEPKLDGLSIELVYENMKLTHAILRGGGDKGEDILKNAKNFEGVLPELKNAPPYVSVRGEVIISQTNFNKLCELSNEAYANRRNCISGICRRYDGLYSDLLGFYAYDIIEIVDNPANYLSELEKLTTLYNYGFRLPFAYNVMTEQQYMQYGDIRDTAENFQMDGLVIKTLDMKHQIALKFEPKGEQTTVTHYTWEVGSTGKLVPTIWFETVNVGGSNLSKAAIGSFQGYIGLNAIIGSKVEVRKMGDVIPKVTRVIEYANGILECPKVCPICGMPLERQGADLYCVNPDCYTKQENKATAIYWAVYLKNVTDTWVKQLLKLGKLRKYYELPFVKVEDIANLDGYSTNKATKIVEHMKSQFLNMLTTNNIEQFLYMLPIPTVSSKAVQKLATLFDSFIAIENWLKDFDINSHKQLVEILGNAKGSKVYDYVSQNKEDILKLLQNIRTIVNA